MQVILDKEPANRLFEYRDYKLFRSEDLVKSAITFARVGNGFPAYGCPLVDVFII